MGIPIIELYENSSDLGGVRARLIFSKSLESQTCPNCKKSGSTVLGIYYKYFHIIRVPFFPLRKTWKTVCENCDFRINHKDHPESNFNEFERIKNDKMAPLSLFIGTIAIVFLITFGLVYYRYTRESQLEYLANPSVGDVYYYETGDGMYSSKKVVEIWNDTLIYVNNKYFVEFKSDIKDINKSNRYSSEEFYYLVYELDSMYQEGTIFKIVRGSNILDIF